MSLKPGYKQTEIGVIPDDWQTQTLGSLLNYEQPTPFLVVSTDYLEFSSVPVLTAGKTFILGYTDEEHGVYSSLPVILFDDFTTACQWVDFPFKVKSSAAKILSGRVGVSDTKFMHEYLSRLSYVPSDHQRHWISVFSFIEVIVPPIKEQKAIAEALSDVDALIDSLEALLTKKRNIKTGVMQELLTGRTRLPGFTGDWQEVRLGDCALVAKGSQLPKTSMTEHGMYPHLNGGISPSGYTDQFNVGPDVVAISEGGNSCGFVQFVKERFWSGGHCYTLQPSGIDRAFLYHALKGQQSRIMRLRVGSGLPNVQKSALMNFVFAAPKESKEQEAIAGVLSDIDDEIEVLEKRLAKTRDLKQGMAQELLTGRTRLA